MTKSSDEGLTWAAQYQVARTTQTARLTGDKIILPSSALQELLDAVSTQSHGGYSPGSWDHRQQQHHQQPPRQLPQPLTFRIVNPSNGSTVYAGVREFSAAENEIELSSALEDALGLGNEATSGKEHGAGEAEARVLEVNSQEKPLITVHAQQLPKGKSVRLRPLEAGYDPGDWKSLLERYFRDNFTTLTSGQVLSVRAGRNDNFQFAIDRLEPSSQAICIVDTDLEVVLEPLDEEQARKSLADKLARKQRPIDNAEGSSLGGLLAIGDRTSGQVVDGDYVDYEVGMWPENGSGLRLELETDEDTAELDLFVSPISSRQRARPRADEHMLGDFSSRPSKRICLAATNEDMKGAEAIQVSVHAYRDTLISEEPLRTKHFVLSVGAMRTDSAILEIEADTTMNADEVLCKNCRQNVPARAISLHEAFCYRNNTSCFECNQVFLKNSAAWKSHWHCPNDSAFGSTAISRLKHDALFHPSQPYYCPNCDFQAPSLATLATHRTSTCPGKEILCQFCLLNTPQQGPDDPAFTDPAVIISGLTPHEYTDGARTTDCHLCSKPVRLRDMQMHLGIHDRDRLLQPTPRICRNALCGNILRSDNADTGLSKTAGDPQLGLCSSCFTPLYASVNDDATGKMLRRRVERRLLQQLMTGCGRDWCRNIEFCRTAAQSSRTSDTNQKDDTSTPTSYSIKEILPIITPTLNSLADASVPLYFCVDDPVSQQRRFLAQSIAYSPNKTLVATGTNEHDDGSLLAQYRLEWWMRALWETKSWGVSVNSDGDSSAQAAIAVGSEEVSEQQKQRQEQSRMKMVEKALQWLKDRAPRVREGSIK